MQMVVYKIAYSMQAVRYTGRTLRDITEAPTHVRKITRSNWLSFVASCVVQTYFNRVLFPYAFNTILVLNTLERGSINTA